MFLILWRGGGKGGNEGREGERKAESTSARHEKVGYSEVITPHEHRNNGV